MGNASNQMITGAIKLVNGFHLTSLIYHAYFRKRFQQGYLKAATLRYIGSGSDAQ
jgi:hypothetical protein